MNELQAIRTQKVVDAQREYEQAAKDLMATVAEVYPIGMELTADLGGRLLILEVIGHAACWWSSPTKIFGRNIVSGKVREFYPSQIK